MTSIKSGKFYDQKKRM